MNGNDLLVVVINFSDGTPSQKSISINMFKEIAKIFIKKIYHFFINFTKRIPFLKKKLKKINLYITEKIYESYAFYKTKYDID